MKVLRVVLSFRFVIIVSHTVSWSIVFLFLRVSLGLSVLVTEVKIIEALFFVLWSNPINRVSSVNLVLLKGSLVMFCIITLSLLVWAQSVVNRHLLLLIVDWHFSKVAVLRGLPLIIVFVRGYCYCNKGK